MLSVTVTVLISVGIIGSSLNLYPEEFSSPSRKFTLNLTSTFVAFMHHYPYP